MIFACKCAAAVEMPREKQIQASGEPTVLAVVGLNSTIDIRLLFDATNRTFIEKKVSQLKTYIDSTDEPSARLTEELVAWKFRRGKKLGRKIWPVCNLLCCVLGLLR